ncbi:carbon monoxide dehydrogenase [Anopheles sinensis]|uniref:Carbon monoxide dehydrogenase n=1 Tax=Anopheles sinensis TaxID=74873 RepID=A0A084WHK8_ANOSI|nr:carbon monoxide dehydrogenase [Anopheles sinensis]
MITPLLVGFTISRAERNFTTHPISSQHLPPIFACPVALLLRDLIDDDNNFEASPGRTHLSRGSSSFVERIIIIVPGRETGSGSGVINVP